jgi:hypothetical protein
MRMRNQFCVVALLMLAPLAYAADDCDAAQPREAAPAARVAPKESCAKPCLIYRISTRCECPLKSTAPATI